MLELGTQGGPRRRTAACSVRPAPPRRPASTGNFTTLLAHSRAETHGPGSSPCLAPLRGVGEGRGGEGARPALHRPGSGSSSFAEWLPMFGRL